MNTKNKQKNSIKSSFFAHRATKASDKGRSPLQKLEESPHSALYLLINSNKNPSALFFCLAAVSASARLLVKVEEQIRCVCYAKYLSA